MNDDVVLAEIKKVLAELESLREVSKRYAWIKDNVSKVKLGENGAKIWVNGVCCWGVDLDDAVDTAIESAGE